MSAFTCREGMRMTRNFICPQTEAPCEKPGCTRDTCIIGKTEAIRARERQAQYWRPFDKEEVDDEMLDVARQQLAQRYRDEHGRWPLARDKGRGAFVSPELEEKARELVRRNHDLFAEMAHDAIRWRKEWVRANPITDEEMKDMGL